MATKKATAAKADTKATASAPAPTQPQAAAAPAPTGAPAESLKDDKPFVAPTQAAPTPPADTAASVHRLERARALPELAQGEPVDVVPDSGIQSFKDIDRRTMNVVLRGNQLFKQQAPERATGEV